MKVEAFRSGFKKLPERVKYGFYLITHPIDGFWDLKRAGRGSIGAALLIIAAFFLSALMKRQLTAWYFNPNWVNYLNIFSELASKLGPYALWCVSVWCVTSLADGESTMKDIIKATGYSLLPLLMTNLVCLILSYAFTQQEMVLYGTLGNIGVIWSYGLIFLSVVVTNQYTVSKAVFVTALSLLGMVVIVCLGMLVFYLVQQMVGFGLDVYKEYSLRIAE